MTTYDWIASTQLAALADGAAVTTANVGSVSGLTLAITTATGGTATKVAATNSLRLKHNAGGTARIELTLTSPSVRMSILMKCTLAATNPAANSRILEVMDTQGSPGSKGRIDHLSASGRIQLYDATNAGIFNTTPDISGDVYIAWGLETDTATTGKYRVNVYDSAYSLIATTTYSNDARNVGLVANLLKTVRAGRINGITDTSDLEIQYIRISDSQITPLTPLASPPTLVLAAASGPYYYYDALTGSTPGSGGSLTFSVSWISGPNNLAGVKELVDGKFFIPQGAAASTYRIEVSEGGNTDFEDVVVPAISTALPTGSVRERYYNGSALV